MVCFCLVVFVIDFLIFLINFGLSVDVGLFKRRILGFMVNVCVKVICCFCLFDKCFG